MVGQAQYAPESPNDDVEIDKIFIVGNKEIEASSLEEVIDLRARKSLDKGQLLELRRSKSTLGFPLDRRTSDTVRPTLSFVR